MRKKSLFLTGIVFLIPMLMAGGCNRPQDPEDSTKVKIYLKAVEIDDVIHLEMHDSNKPANKVIDDLGTLVPAGSTVIWKRTVFSGIKKIERIASKSGAGTIFRGDAQQIGKTKRFKLEIPTDASPGDQEYYLIEFRDRDNNPQSIDPYLRIPDIVQ